MDAIHFNYPEVLRKTAEEWKVEVINVFRCFDSQKTGGLPRETAVEVMALFGMNGEEHFHFSKKTITLKMFLDAVQHDRDRNSDLLRRWKYLFQLIAGTRQSQRRSSRSSSQCSGTRRTRSSARISSTSSTECQS
jgi:hypothetical protein